MKKFYIFAIITFCNIALANCPDGYIEINDPFSTYTTTDTCPSGYSINDDIPSMPPCYGNSKTLCYVYLPVGTTSSDETGQYEIVQSNDATLSICPL